MLDSTVAALDFFQTQRIGRTALQWAGTELRGLLAASHSNTFANVLPGAR